ncbi:MAG TPA: hypothetical protein VGK67_22500 [Myxococcales bacterium]
MSKRNAVLVVIGIAAAVAVVVAVLLRKPQQGAGGPVDPLEMLPDRCQAVIVVPDPGRLGEHLSVLPRLKVADLLASLQNYPSAEALLGDLAKQAGYDPRSRESMRQGGIDPSRPIVGYLSEQAVPLALIPVTDQAKFEERFAKSAAARLGDRKPVTEKVGQDRTLTVVTGPGPNPQLVAWAFVGGYALLTQSQAGLALLKTALAQPTQGSLAKDTRFAATRTRLADRDLFAFSCLDALPLQKQVFMPYGTTFAASLSERELRLSFELPLNDEWNERLKSLATPAGADLVAAMGPEAFLVGRLGGDPALLEPLVNRMMPAVFQRAFREGGVDVVADILKNLKPGIAGALSLAPTARLSGVPELDVRRTNPFDYLQLAVVGRTSDSARAAKTLGSMAEVAPRFGSTMESTEIGGAKVFVTRYHLGEGASLALDGDKILVTGGTGQMQAQLDRLRSPTPKDPADPQAARALKEDAFALWLDVSRLTAGVRTLPDSAYGIGGWAIKAAVSRWLEAIDEITGLRASGRLADKTLSAELALTLKLAPVQAQTPTPKDARATP